MDERQLQQNRMSLEVRIHDGVYKVEKYAPYNAKHTLPYRMCCIVLLV